MNAVKEDVISLVHKELESANKQFPLFNSAHEGFAVIFEEVEEVGECFDNTNVALRELWNQVRSNSEIDYDIEVLRDEAINGAIEFIQVAAMAQKFIESMKDPVAEKLGELLEGERKRIGGK